MTHPADGPRLFDTHCHLYDDRFDPDREAVLTRALDTLDGVVVIGDALDTSRLAVALCRPSVYAAVGFHPYHAGDVRDDTFAALRELAQRQDVVALGEMGLDYYRYCETPRPVQRMAFEAQLNLAMEIQFPVVIHNRDADEDMAAVLSSCASRLSGGIMHCFSGDAAFAEQCVAWGLHVSFAGNVTYPKAADLREAACRVPIDRLLVETDSPYLAPQPVRGKRCEPAHVCHTAQSIADCRGVDVDCLARETTANARRLFKLDDSRSDDAHTEGWR